MNKTISYISAQPDEPTFIWQTDVYLENFISKGIPPEHCVALFGIQPGNTVSTGLKELCLKYPHADIRAYFDTRSNEGRSYPPSIQPHLISKAFVDTPEWENHPVFYHDCDIAFLNLPDYKAMLEEDGTACFLSDTDNYIGYEYLHKCCEKIKEEKGDAFPEDELIQRMCAIVGIDVELIRGKKGGGGQYLLQGIGRSYWDKVYADSLGIHQLFQQYFGNLGLKKSGSDYIQTWTAGMWAYLWNLWRLGKEVIIHPELAFLFPGDALDKKTKILHMAGLQEELKISHFNKSRWKGRNPLVLVRKLPYLFDHIKGENASAVYVNMIRQAAGLGTISYSPPKPAKKWRFISWQTDKEDVKWEIEKINIQLPEEIEVQRLSEGAHWGESYGIDQVLLDNQQNWMGKPLELERGVAAFYFGFELSQESIPQQISLIQGGKVKERMLLFQFEDDSGQWNSVRAIKVHANTKAQRLFYQAPNMKYAYGWKIIAKEANKGFAWDIKRLHFLGNSKEFVGAIDSSPFALPKQKVFSPQNVLQDELGFWGGRKDKDGKFWLKIESNTLQGVNQLILNQGDTHFVSTIEVQVKNESHQWETLGFAENLKAGINDILLENLKMGIDDKKILLRQAD